MRRDQGALLAIGAAGALVGASLLGRGRGGRNQARTQGQPQAGTQLQVTQAGPIVIAQSKIEEHLRDPSKIEALIDAFDEEGGGHYTRRGPDNVWQFNIKAHGIYDVPDWVQQHLGEEVWDWIRMDVSDQLRWFLDELGSNPAAEPWWDGEVHHRGKQGGYILLGYGGIQEDLSTLYDDWEDNTRRGLGGRRTLDPDYREELGEAIRDALVALEGRRRLEREIKQGISELEKMIASDEHWEDRLEITKAQAQAQAQKKRRGRRR